MQRIWTSGLLAAALSLCYAAIASAQDCPRQPKKEWTVLVFMLPQPDLNPFVQEDLDEMKEVKSTDDLNVVVQVDTVVTPRRLRITHQRETACAPPGGGPIAQTLKEFLAWGVKTFPSKHLMVVLWGHGHGIGERLRRASLHARHGTRPGDDSPRPILSRAEATWPASGRASLAPPSSSGRQALPGENSLLGVTKAATVLAEAVPDAKVDILGFDSCFMSGVEAGYQFRDKVDFMIASQHFVPNEGWEYTSVLTAMQSAGAESPEQVVRHVVEDASAVGHLASQSALDLRAADGVLAALKKLTSAFAVVRTSNAERLIARNVFDRAAFRLVRQFVDLADLCHRIIDEYRGTGREPIVEAAQSVLDSLKAFIRHHRPDNGGPLNGLSIYYPARAAVTVPGDPGAREINAEIDRQEYRELELVSRTGWLDLVTTLRPLPPLP